MRARNCIHPAFLSWRQSNVSHMNVMFRGSEIKGLVIHETAGSVVTFESEKPLTGSRVGTRLGGWRSVRRWNLTVGTFEVAHPCRLPVFVPYPWARTLWRNYLCHLCLSRSCRYDLSPGFPATVDWESLKARIRIDLSSAKLLLSGFVVASNTSVATTVWETVEPSCGLRRQSKVFQSSQAVILRKHLSCSLKVKASYKKGMNHCINYSGLQVL